MSSRATLPPAALAVLFGRGARLGPSARVEVVQRGEVVASVPVEAGEALALALDATDDVTGRVRLRGPLGATEPITPSRVRSRIVLPDGLRRAWGLGDLAPVALGQIACSLDVTSGPETVIEVERALWLGAGRPETGRWLAGVDLALDARPTEPETDGRIDRRVVTENDVRQARRKRQRIRLRPGQIVTPAARALAREWDVFDDAS